MICPNCKIRWADFPEDDFDINEKGIISKSKKAENKRIIQFNSDEILYCGCVEEEYAHEQS